MIIGSALHCFMVKVIMTEKRRRFEDVQNNMYDLDRRFKVCFENGAVRKAYDNLLEHPCVICNGPEGGQDQQPSKGGEGGAAEEQTSRPAGGSRRVFSTFKVLEHHVKKEHDRFFCQFCVDHLKVVGIIDEPTNIEVPGDEMEIPFNLADLHAREEALLLVRTGHAQGQG